MNKNLKDKGPLIFSDNFVVVSKFSDLCRYSVVDWWRWG